MDWMFQSMQPHSAIFAPFMFASLFTILPLVAWSLIWKGWALYLAARRKEVYWFIALLIINTAGLLEIFYIFAIAKRSDTIVEKTTVEVEKDEIRS